MPSSAEVFDYFQQPDPKAYTKGQQLEPIAAALSNTQALMDLREEQKDKFGIEARHDCLAQLRAFQEAAAVLLRVYCVLRPLYVQPARVAALKCRAEATYAARMSMKARKSARLAGVRISLSLAQARPLTTEDCPAPQGHADSADLQPVPRCELVGGEMSGTVGPRGCIRVRPYPSCHNLGVVHFPRRFLPNRASNILTSSTTTLPDLKSSFRSRHKKSRRF